MQKFEAVKYNIEFKEYRLETPNLKILLSVADDMFQKSDEFLEQAKDIFFLLLKCF